MSENTISNLLHAAEAIVVFGMALLVAHFFPEHKEEASGAAVAILSFLARSARTSDAVPIPDYINQPKQ